MSLIEEWNAIAVVSATVSWSLHSFRYSAITAMSDERTSSTLDQLAFEYNSARSCVEPYCSDDVCGTSLTYMLKRVGARTEPCLTQFLSCWERLTWPPLISRKRLLLEMEMDMKRSWWWSGTIHGSFRMGPWWQTVSYSAVRSTSSLPCGQLQGFARCHQ